MKKVLSTLSRLSVRQKLFLVVIGLGLAPTLGMLVWGINIAIHAPEFVQSDWTNPNHPTPTP